MATNDKGSSLELQTITTEDETADETVDERTVYLSNGRTLAVASSGIRETIEVRASSGQVEVRIRMTEDGPVLQLDGAKLEVTSEDSINLNCKTFSVNASESMELASQGGLQVKSEEELNIKSTKDVRVTGEKIWLN